MTTRATRSPRRRTVVALAVVLAVFAAFVVRLVDIQVVNASGHVADAQQTGRLGVERTLPGTRGPIVDENGTTLASSVLVYDAQLDPSLIHGLETDTKRPPKVPWAEASEQIAEIIGVPGEEIRAKVAEAIETNPDSQYLPWRSRSRPISSSHCATSRCPTCTCLRRIRGSTRTGLWRGTSSASSARTACPSRDTSSWPRSASLRSMASRPTCAARPAWRSPEARRSQSRSTAVPSS
ncbi:hypothetical protein [Microbacterium sp. NIBRBAC000506063]|uniref:hypothetical protein n=1 Tax=Microbacterium sp. NIBRBAC000506063 TaxID=2734618 RepID=UPI002948BD5A|nr:hypothetical protein [Microbacterium sp. NIBRBAC000506063]